VFHKLREHFGIKSEDYVHSIGPGNMLSNLMLGSLSSLAELGSEGKSGSFFYFTSDNMYLVKTVHKDEHKLLRQILPQYYHHMTRPGNSGPGEPKPESLLTRIVGCHVLRLSKHSKIGADKIYFVVMTNILNTDLDISRRFDLKGSWVGRKTNDGGEDLKNAKVTLKDNDLKELGQHINIGPARKAMLMAALKRDVEFLEAQNIIDYSLLLGIHDHSSTGVSVRTISSAGSSSVGGLTSFDSPRSSDDLDEDDERLFTSEYGKKPKRKPAFFQESHGGMRSIDGKETYIMGILDFLTVYNGRKRAERFGKSMLLYDRGGISVMPPHGYAKRFLDFMDGVIS